MPSRVDWRTRANALTLLRLLAAPALVLAIVRGADLVAGAIFALAVATDFADGWLARKHAEATAFGAYVDHTVDAIFVTACSAALAWAGALPAALPPLIAIAFVQYAIDSRFLVSRGLRTSSLGRWNGIGYFVAVGVPVVRDALGLGFPGAGVVTALGWLLVVTTVFSMIDRLALVLRTVTRESSERHS